MHRDTFNFGQPRVASIQEILRAFSQTARLVYVRVLLSSGALTPPQVIAEDGEAPRNDTHPTREETPWYGVFAGSKHGFVLEWYRVPGGVDRDVLENAATYAGEAIGELFSPR